MGTKVHDRFDFSRLSVLVVDDNAHMRKLVRDILHAFGITTVLEAADGSDAYVLLRMHYIDIVICDWVMDRVTGIELLRQVREKGNGLQNPDIAFIMMTAHSDKQRVLEAREAGVTTFLVKPFSTAALYERVLWVIESSQELSRPTGRQSPETDNRRESNGQ
jgi:CheY-like chemotaxis protein